MFKFAENKLQTLVDIEYIQSLLDIYKFIIGILSISRVLDEINKHDLYINYRNFNIQELIPIYAEIMPIVLQSHILKQSYSKQTTFKSLYSYISQINKEFESIEIKPIK